MSHFDFVSWKSTRYSCYFSSKLFFPFQPLENLTHSNGMAGGGECDLVALGLDSWRTEPQNDFSQLESTLLVHFIRCTTVRWCVYRHYSADCCSTSGRFDFLLSDCGLDPGCPSKTFDPWHKQGIPFHATAAHWIFFFGGGNTPCGHVAVFKILLLFLFSFIRPD